VCLAYSLKHILAYTFIGLRIAAQPCEATAAVLGWVLQVEKRKFACHVNPMEAKHNRLYEHLHYSKMV
jgi:hypothetical protein